MEKSSMRDMTTIVPCAVRLRLAPSFAGYVVMIATGLFVPSIAVPGIPGDRGPASRPEDDIAVLPVQGVGSKPCPDSDPDRLTRARWECTVGGDEGIHGSPPLSQHDSG